LLALQTHESAPIALVGPGVGTGPALLREALLFAQPLAPR
jgi:hypothetical protein